MCNDVSHTPEVWQAGMLGVYQQGSFSVGDEPPVLHGPSSKVGDANQVQLWQREWDPKQGLESWQHLHSDVKGCFQIASPASATYSIFRTEHSPSLLHQQHKALIKGNTNVAAPTTYSTVRTQP